MPPRCWSCWRRRAERGRTALQRLERVRSPAQAFRARLSRLLEARPRPTSTARIWPGAGWGRPRRDARVGRWPVPQGRAVDHRGASLSRAHADPPPMPRGSSTGEPGAGGRAGSAASPMPDWPALRTDGDAHVRVDAPGRAAACPSNRPTTCGTFPDRAFERVRPLGRPSPRHRATTSRCGNMASYTVLSNVRTRRPWCSACAAMRKSAISRRGRLPERRWRA